MGDRLGLTGEILSPCRSHGGFVRLGRADVNPAPHRGVCVAFNVLNVSELRGPDSLGICVCGCVCVCVRESVCVCPCE